MKAISGDSQEEENLNILALSLPPQLPPTCSGFIARVAPILLVLVVPPHVFSRRQGLKATMGMTT